MSYNSYMTNTKNVSVSVRPEPSINNAQGGVRQAILDMPSYPFTPIDVPCKLDQNENPYDFPEELKQEALRRMMERPWNIYPDLSAETIREGLARFEDWDIDGIAVTPGSNQMIKILTEMAGINQTLLTVNPTFAVYTMEAKMLNAKLITVTLNEDFSLPVEGLRKAIQEELPGVFFITQPHAPTGHRDETQTVTELVLEAEAKGWIVVIDEAYYMYSNTDYRDLIRKGKNLASLRTFSKCWGLAGVRAGYILTSPELAANIRKLVSAFGMNTMAQCVLEVALENPEYIKASIQESIRERERITEALKNHPTCEIISGYANYFIIRTSDHKAAAEFLVSRGIVGRPQHGQLYLDNCIRIGIGTPEQNDQVIAAIKDLR